MASINQKKRSFTSENFSDELASYADNFRHRDNSFDRNNKPDDSQKDEILNKSSYKWMYSKLLNYYAALVLGLLSLTYFNFVSVEIFVTGLFSGFSICFAMIGHGMVELLRQDQHTNPDLWETQDESTFKN